jgi:hypothetical protein
MSKLMLRRVQSTPCLRRLFLSLLIKANWPELFRAKEETARRFYSLRKVGIDLEKLAADLQSQGTKSFDESWQNLLGAVESKGKELLQLPRQ